MEKDSRLSTKVEKSGMRLKRQINLTKFG